MIDRIGNGVRRDAYLLELVEGSAEIELKYFRLAHTRTLKESYRFNVFQTQTFNGPSPPNTGDKGMLVNDLLGVPVRGGAAMQVIGKDPRTQRINGASTISYISTNKTWDGF